jgi:LmbE family N-acetylglucosaminyl deacetylase
MASWPQSFAFTHASGHHGRKHGQPESVSQNPSRRDELRASAGLLGAARVAYLGYADSGHGPVLVMASRVLRPQRLGGSYALAAAVG